jgi:uracil DNA glycosylase
MLEPAIHLSLNRQLTQRTMEREPHVRKVASLVQVTVSANLRSVSELFLTFGVATQTVVSLLREKCHLFASAPHPR